MQARPFATSTGGAWCQIAGGGRLRKVLVVVVLGILVTLGTATPAAHQAPCEDTEAGHADYAQHHVVPLAQEPVA